jgi:hypothetical protein
MIAVELISLQHLKLHWWSPIIAHVLKHNSNTAG